MKREELMQLYIKPEIGRRRRAPSFDRAQVRNGIERRIYFDHFEMLRVPTKSLMRRQLFRVPVPDKTRIGPTSGADKNFPAHKATKSPRRRKQTRFVRFLTDFRFAGIDNESILSARGGAAW